MKKVLILLLVVALSVAILAGCESAGSSKYNVDLTEGGELGAFDFDTLTELQKTWTLKSGGTSGNVFSIWNSNNSTVANGITVDTSSAGWASISQKLVLRPNSYYKVSYRFTTSSMAAFEEDKPFVGLYVGFAENPDFNILDDKPTEQRTSTNNGSAEYYFKTTNIREVTLSVNVGTEELPVVAKNVTIKDLSIERVSRVAAEEGGAVSALYTLTSTVYGATSYINLVYVVIGAVMTLVAAYIAYILRARNAYLINVRTHTKFYDAILNGKSAGVLLAAGIALLTRLVIVLIQTALAGASDIRTVYFGFDIEQLATQGLWIATNGTPYFFEYNTAASMMPGSLYLATIAGLFGRLIGLINGTTDATVLLTTVAVIKLLTVLADIGTVIIIYKWIARRYDRVTATVMASFYSVVPAVLSMSAAWGSMESVTAFFVVLAFYMISRRDYIGMAASYFTACLFTVSALYVVPFVLFYTAAEIYVGIKEGVKAKWIMPAVAIPAGLVAYILIALPFSVNQMATEPFFAYNALIAAVRAANVYTANAFNFQALLGNNFAEVTTQSTFVTIVFVIFILAILGFVYFRKRNRTDLLALAGGFVVVYWLFGNNMTQASLFIALPLLFLYAVLSNDKRLYAAFAMYASLMFINAAYIYLLGGYTSDGIVHLTYDTPVMYVIGAFHLALIIYFVIVGYDVLVNRKVVEFNEMDCSYADYVKATARGWQYRLQRVGAKTSGTISAIGKMIKSERKSKNDSDEEN